LEGIEMTIQIKPETELIVSATSIAVVYAIFSQALPPMADVRADKPAMPNTHKSIKMAAITSTAAVGALALLGKSPTVFVIGGGAILFETWKYHYANHAVNGNQENAEALATG
jgi:hypothetical protein